MGRAGQRPERVGETLAAVELARDRIGDLLQPHELWRALRQLDEREAAGATLAVVDGVALRAFLVERLAAESAAFRAWQHLDRARTELAALIPAEASAPPDVAEPVAGPTAPCEVAAEASPDQAMVVASEAQTTEASDPVPPGPPDSLVPAASPQAGKPRVKVKAQRHVLAPPAIAVPEPLPEAAIAVDEPSAAAGAATADTSEAPTAALVSVAPAIAAETDAVPDAVREAPEPSPPAAAEPHTGHERRTADAALPSGSVIAESPPEPAVHADAISDAVSTTPAEAPAEAEAPPPADDVPVPPSPAVTSHVDPALIAALARAVGAARPWLPAVPSSALVEAAMPPAAVAPQQQPGPPPEDVPSLSVLAAMETAAPTTPGEAVAADGTGGAPTGSASDVPSTRAAAPAPPDLTAASDAAPLPASASPSEAASPTPAPVPAAVPTADAPPAAEPPAASPATAVTLPLTAATLAAAWPDGGTAVGADLIPDAEPAAATMPPAPASVPPVEPQAADASPSPAPALVQPPPATPAVPALPEIGTAAAAPDQIAVDGDTPEPATGARPEDPAPPPPSASITPAPEVTAVPAVAPAPAPETTASPDPVAEAPVLSAPPEATEAPAAATIASNEPAAAPPVPSDLGPPTAEAAGAAADCAAELARIRPLASLETAPESRPGTLRFGGAVPWERMTDAVPPPISPEPRAATATDVVPEASAGAGPATTAAAAVDPVVAIEAPDARAGTLASALAGVAVELPSVCPKSLAASPPVDAAADAGPAGDPAPAAPSADPAVATAPAPRIAAKAASERISALEAELDRMITAAYTPVPAEIAPRAHLARLGPQPPPAPAAATPLEAPEPEKPVVISLEPAILEDVPDADDIAEAEIEIITRPPEPRPAARTAIDTAPAASQPIPMPAVSEAGDGPFAPGAVRDDIEEAMVEIVRPGFSLSEPDPAATPDTQVPPPGNGPRPARRFLRALTGP